MEDQRDKQNEYVKPGPSKDDWSTGAEPLPVTWPEPVQTEAGNGPGLTGRCPNCAANLSSDQEYCSTCGYPGLPDSGRTGHYEPVGPRPEVSGNPASPPKIASDGADRVRDSDSISNLVKKVKNFLGFRQ